MKTMKFFVALLAALVFVIAGCSNDQAFSPSSNVVAKSNTRGLAKGPVIQSVTGSGHFRESGELRTFSFTARKYDDGTYDGEWQLLNRLANVIIHGNVICFSINGNQAWIGGVAESGPFPGEAGWRVVDNGEGTNQPNDEISTAFVGAGTGFAAGYCATQPLAPALNLIEAGNIQVRP